MKCEKCNKEIPDNKTPEEKTIKIFSKYDKDKVIFEFLGESLRDANFRGADLREADLQGVDLGGADLREADLRWADLRWADLKWADLRGAKTTGCMVNFIPEEYEQAKQFIEGLKLI